MSALAAFSSSLQDPNIQAPADPNAQAPADPNAQAPADPNAQAPADPNAQAPADPNAEAPADLNLQTSATPNAQPILNVPQFKKLTPDQAAACQQYLTDHRLTADLISEKLGTNPDDYQPGLNNISTSIDAIV